jgi:glutathione S-transferase
MSQVYRIYGAELSPYSVKVRSFCRYKEVPHRWLVRDASTIADYQKFAKLPLIPLLVTPADEGIQDSTPIMELLEERFTEPSTHPEEPAARFLSYLLEEFGDEWGNKWMFHLRWARDEDCLSAGGRIAASMVEPGDEAGRIAMREKVIERMRGRVGFVGSSAATAPQIETSFRDALAILDAHLASRPYLFGARPAFGDFGLWGQIYEAWTDPTGGAWIERGAPNVLDWIQRMLWPRAEGPFEPVSSLLPTLEPLLVKQVGALFLPWTLANEAAIAAGEDSFDVELAGRRFSQKPQKYHVRSLAALRTRHAEIADRLALDPILERTGCLNALRTR